MFNWIFSSNKKETFSESMVNSLCQDLTDLVEGALPNTKEKVERYLLDSKKGFIDGLKEIIDENKELSEEQAILTKERTKQFLNTLKNKFINYVTIDLHTDDPTFLKKVDTMIDNQHNMIALSCDITKENLKNYKTKIERAEKWLNLVSKEKKTIKILIIGATQKGKTTLACLISGISKKDLKGSRPKGFGVTSDTTEVTAYTLHRNGVELIWIDTPGWWDSRGEKQDNANQEAIQKYIENNKDIDVIMFVAKLGDTLDGNLQKSISDFGKKCGKQIWEKSLIVLTYSLSVASPSEYIEMAQQELYPDAQDIYSDKAKMAEIKILAWSKFTKASSETWQQYFHIQNDDTGTTAKPETTPRIAKTATGLPVTETTTGTGTTPETVTIPGTETGTTPGNGTAPITGSIPVCLVESSPYELPIETGKPKHILYDGTPFLQELMYQILILVDRKKSPIAFLAMAKETEIMTPHSNNLNNAANQALSSSSSSSTSSTSSTLSSSKNEGWSCLLL